MSTFELALTSSIAQAWSSDLSLNHFEAIGAIAYSRTSTAAQTSDIDQALGCSIPRCVAEVPANSQISHIGMLI